MVGNSRGVFDRVYLVGGIGQLADQLYLGLSFALLQITESEGADEVLLTKQIDNETCVALPSSLPLELAAQVENLG